MNNTVRGALHTVLWSMFIFGLGACGVEQQGDAECMGCGSAPMAVQKAALCGADADCDPEPEPSDGGTVVVLSQYDAAVRNSAAESRTCVLQVMHNGVHKDLFRGVLSPGETVTFAGAVMAVAPFYVETTAGCEGGPPSDTGLTPIHTFKSTFYRSTLCRFSYHEPIALSQACWAL